MYASSSRRSSNSSLHQNQSSVEFRSMSEERCSNEEEESASISFDAVKFRSLFEEKCGKEAEEDASISLEGVLPDELLEKVLSLLPIASFLNSALVCKRWHAVVRRPWSVIPPPQEAWLFMSTTDTFPKHGHVYNPSLRRWYTFGLPFVRKRKRIRSIASSCGLVSHLQGTRNFKLAVFVCNHITQEQRRLPRFPRVISMFSSDVAMSVDLQTNSYAVAVVKNKLKRQVFSVLVYESKTRAWSQVLEQPQPVAAFASARHAVVICNGVLHCMYRKVICYSLCLLPLCDLTARPQPKLLVPTEIPLPPRVLFPQLMNLREKLIIVGRIVRSRGKVSTTDKMKAIGIWMLTEAGWTEVAQMPQELIQQRDYRFCRFVTRGAGDFIFINSLDSSVMLIFDMARMHWQWTNYPVSRREDNWYRAFCFEPNLKIDY